MKTQHEKLKEICDKIGYKSIFEYDDSPEDIFNQYDRLYFTEWDKWSCKNRIIDVREIIFTQEFMDKYVKRIEENLNKDTRLFYTLLECNLKDPVWYLYELIKQND